nr:hypothetical protein [Tanacetum cinerariifolium]
MVNWAKMEVETEGVEARTGTTKGVKARNSTTEGVKARTRTKDKGKEKSDDDSDYQSDKSVEYLNPGEDELIELRNRMKANRKAKTKAKHKPDSKINEPNEENSMPADNVRDPFIFVEKHVEKYPMYDETTHWRLRKPKVGKKYTSVAQFKECLTYYALANGLSLWHERSGKERAVAKCRQRPPRVSTPEKAEHTCVRNFNFGTLVNYKWIAKIIGDKFRANPNIKLYDIADLVMKMYKCKVNLNQCVNAKKYALTEYEKSIGEHYGMLRSYGKATLDSNPGLADGWKAGCRKINALDGCFLKSPNQGEILTAISRDDNNQIYPVAWAVGLIEGVKDVMPNAKHRQCARHIYESSRKQYTGLEYRQLFWKTSKASYPQLFNKIIDKIKSANPNAHKYLMDNNPKTWSRAFFEVDKGCEAIENGFSECFNSMIVNVRHKPLLTILEAIRVIVIERMNKIRKISRKWNLRFWQLIPTGGNLFEVRSGSEGFTLDEGKRTCSCRMWQLSGLPCVHATKVIFLINRVPESYVLAWFETNMYYVAYHNYVKPVPGMNFWPGQSMYSTVLPPKPRKMFGMPKKKRIRAIGEGGSSTRVSKDVDVHRGLVRDEGAGWTRGGAIRSRGRGAGGSGGNSVSRGKGAGGSRGRGAGGSKRKTISTSRTQIRQGKKVVGTSGFAKWFGLQDKPEQTQDEPEQTQAEAQQTQQEPEKTQEQVQPQEQPQQPQKQPHEVALRMPSASILQRKLGKQGRSQNTALNLD